jgi:hypothetical protein
MLHHLLILIHPALRSIPDLLSKPFLGSILLSAKYFSVSSWLQRLSSPDRRSIPERFFLNLNIPTTPYKLLFRNPYNDSQPAFECGSVNTSLRYPLIWFNQNPFYYICSGRFLDSHLKTKRPLKDTIMVSSEGLSYIAFLFDYLPSISPLYQVNRADLG